MKYLLGILFLASCCPPNDPDCMCYYFNDFYKYEDIAGVKIYELTLHECEHCKILRLESYQGLYPIDPDHLRARRSSE